MDKPPEYLGIKPKDVGLELKDFEKGKVVPVKRVNFGEVDYRMDRINRRQEVFESTCVDKKYYPRHAARHAARHAEKYG